MDRLAYGVRDLLGRLIELVAAIIIDRDSGATNKQGGKGMFTSDKEAAASADHHATITIRLPVLHHHTTAAYSSLGKGVILALSLVKLSKF